MTKKFRDFDAFWGEQKKEPIRFRAFGREYELPPSPKASLILSMQRLRKEKGDDATIGEDQLVVLLEHLIGKEEVDTLADEGLTLEQLEDLILWVGAQYGLHLKDEGDDSGNAET